MKIKIKRVKKGFTLLEILLVIVAIGILAAIVLVAINPNRQISQVRNAQRRSDVNTLYKALEQYLIDNQVYPADIDGTTSKEVCNTGTRSITDDLPDENYCDGKADLRVLVPDYIAAIPVDPSGNNYTVRKNESNSNNIKICVNAPGVELGKIIKINCEGEDVASGVLLPSDISPFIEGFDDSLGESLYDEPGTNDGSYGYVFNTTEESIVNALGFSAQDNWTNTNLTYTVQLLSFSVNPEDPDIETSLTYLSLAELTFNPNDPDLLLVDGYYWKPLPTPINLAASSSDPYTGYSIVAIGNFTDNLDLTLRGNFKEIDGQPIFSSLGLYEFGGYNQVGAPFYPLPIQSNDQYGYWNTNISIKSLQDPTPEGFNGRVETLAIQSDGKIFVGGWFTNYEGVDSVNKITRLNSDGSRDDTFIGSGFDSEYNDDLEVTRVDTIAIQANGKIVVGGSFTSYQGIASNRIIRLNSDGSIDTSFNVEIEFDDWVSAIAIQSDGKILVGADYNKIIRLNSNGSIDSSFNIGTGFNNAVTNITLQSDGKVLVGGVFTGYNGELANRITRLNSNGSRDLSFDMGSGFNNTVQTITVDSDGKIIVGGDFTSYKDQIANYLIIIYEYTKRVISH
jgi:uncharacterized delta-60 repeat protein/prepilin-type N-terminal cleavage/methylation domain-containing protein